MQRKSVLAAEVALGALIERLGHPEPVRAEGMAIATRIVADAEWSALYNSAEPGPLRRQVMGASAALQTHYQRAGEFPPAS